MRRPLCMVCLVFVSVIFLYVHLWPPPDMVSADAAEGEWIYLTGKLYQKEQRRNRFGSEYVVFYLNQIRFCDKSGMELQNKNPRQKKEKGVMCYMKQGTEQVPLGSYVFIAGKMQEFLHATNPGEFDSKEYYQILNLDFKIKDAEIRAISKENNKLHELLYKIKEKGSELFDSFYDNADAGIMKAVLLGDKNNLEEEIKEQYKRNGILHIMAISGMHISMLGMGLYRLLGKCRLPAGAAGVICVLLMWLYGIMTGMSTSAYRAIFMFSMKMAADMLGRTYDMLTALALSAVLLLAEQPLYVKHSGFLMSFGAVIGIGGILPVLEKIGKREKEKRKGVVDKIEKGLLSGAAVFLMTFPIQLYFYYQYPVYSLVLNLLIVPLVGVVMASGIAVLLLAEAAQVAAAAAFAGHMVLQWFTFCCGGTEQLPGAVWITGKPGGVQIALFYLLLFILAAGSGNFRKKKHQRLAFCLGVLAAAAVLTAKGRAGLEITFLDVGQGDGIYIQSKSGACLIDGGSTSKKEVGNYQLIPFLKSKGAGTLEAVIITHGDKDHYTGIEELLEKEGADRIRIKRLILPAGMDEACIRLARLAKEREIPVFFAEAGAEIRVGGIKMECFNPAGEGDITDKNEQSLVWLLTAEDFTALFTGDITGRAELAMQRKVAETLSGKRLTVLKVAHHGSMHSTTEEFLEEVRPHYSIISCAADNSYGHPHKELMERLEKSGTQIWETGKSGAVCIWTDGKQVKAEGFLHKNNIAVSRIELKKH